MSKKRCYFKCKYDGQLYNFPPVTYNSYEKFLNWKKLLKKEDQKKSDKYIVNNFKLCSRHFEKYYIAANSRLIKHAVPTLIHGITQKQEELLCSFVEKNSKIIMHNLSGHMSEKVNTEWKTIEPQLNKLGPEKNYGAWAEYLYEVISNLKKKKVIWVKESSRSEEESVVKNTEDFTELELKVLQIWHEGSKTQYSQDPYESDYKDEIDTDMSDMIDIGDNDNSRDSESSQISLDKDDTTNEIVTFTVNVTTGGEEPLLQAADIAPYEARQNISKIKCICKHKQTDSETQDEFDAFGKDIAQQLRNMSRKTALDTQKLMKSILRSKQSKVLNDSFLPH